MLITVAYVLHVVAAAFWTGATLYVVYAVVPDASNGRLSAEALVGQIHRLLLITRWTGVVLPVTGAYLVWVFYWPPELLFETTRGWAVLAMFGLWGVMNTLVEVGVLRMRNVVDQVGFGTYMSEGFPREILSADTTAKELAAPGRAYLYASAVCAVLLLADAALLAAGIA